MERLTAALADRYKIERELGQGGMAKVYLAEDLKHHRKVALKVLRPELAAVIGAERFLQEIEVTANLQHPNILPLYDSGEADTFLYYVMPYLEGESLRDRLKREHQLPVEETVETARAVAAALQYAHQHGVVHRDIKPENILFQSGQALVADFGIALAVSQAGGIRLTETGLSLGTPHYMSPEQATGDRQLDARSDVYSLGAVVYEMLVGEPPHLGNSVQAIVAKILSEPPAPVRRVRSLVPTNVDAAIQKALTKSPADRFKSAAEFAAALANPSFTLATFTGATATPDARGIRRARLLGAAAMVGWSAALGLALALWLARGNHQPAILPMLRTTIELPDSAPLAFVGSGTLGVGRVSLATSPDGKILVYTAKRGASTQLYLHRLDELSTTPLTGTEGAYSPFFSPDGGWIGFFVGIELKKVPVNGGPPTHLADVPEPTGASWGTDGRILVAAREGNQFAWVPASGGDLEPLPNSSGFVYRDAPYIMPGADYAVSRAAYEASGLSATSLKTGVLRYLTQDGPVAQDSVDFARMIGGNNPRYVPTGHLLYSSGNGILMAMRFDPARLQVLGSPVEAQSGMRMESEGAAQYTVTGDGTLIYAPGSPAWLGRLVWRNRTGRLDTLPFEPRNYGTFDLSPDGHRVAILLSPPSSAAEVWVYDLDRGVPLKVATGEMPEDPRWWPDGKHLVITESSTRPPYRLVAIRQLPGSAARDTLLIVDDVSLDSKWLAGEGGPGASRPGIWVVPVNDTTKPVQVDPFPTAWGPAFSPDGRWLAYTSNQSGRYEVYVVSTSWGGERQKISPAGGEEPVWSPRGDELIYRNARQWFAVSVPARESIVFGRSHLLFEGPFINVPERSHDISPDGVRHLLVLGSPDETVDHLIVVTNWLDEVRRLTASNKP